VDFEDFAVPLAEELLMMGDLTRPEDVAKKA
jgi:hypothetical protein